MSQAAKRMILPKSMTGISGFDGITNGGLPRNRTTLVIGTPGAGKTIFSMEVLYRGAAQYGEPGIYVNFGDPREKVLIDIKTFDWDLEPLLKDNRLIISDLRGGKAANWQNSNYKVDALLEAIAYAVKHTGAKRVALDETDLTLPGAVTTNFSGSDMKRIMREVEGMGVTLIMTSVAATDPRLPCSLEEYMADCVIALERKMVNQVATRRLRIMKYRGTEHGSHEYPYQICSNGIHVMPVSTLSLSSAVSDDRISSGVRSLDHMLDGGYFRESVVLIEGTAGTGKSNLAISCAGEGCKRGERALYISYEESPAQLKRNFQSIGMNLDDWEDNGLLKIEGILPETFGIDEHLSNMENMIDRFQPSILVIDSLSALNRISSKEVSLDPTLSILAELKNRGIIVLATMNSTTCGNNNSVDTAKLNCFADTILELNHIKSNQGIQRGILILKSRGMKHSLDMREFLITSKGLKIGNLFQDHSDFVKDVARKFDELKEQTEHQESAPFPQTGQMQTGYSGVMPVPQQPNQTMMVGSTATMQPAPVQYMPPAGQGVVQPQQTVPAMHQAMYVSSPATHSAVQASIPAPVVSPQPEPAQIHEQPQGSAVQPITHRAMDVQPETDSQEQQSAVSELPVLNDGEQNTVTASGDEQKVVEQGDPESSEIQNGEVNSSLPGIADAGKQPEITPIERDNELQPILPHAMDGQSETNSQEQQSAVSAIAMQNSGEQNTGAASEEESIIPEPVPPVPGAEHTSDTTEQLIISTIMSDEEKKAEIVPGDTTLDASVEMTENPIDVENFSEKIDTNDENNGNGHDNGNTQFSDASTGQIEQAFTAAPETVREVSERSESENPSDSQESQDNDVTPDVSELQVKVTDEHSDDVQEIPINQDQISVAFGTAEVDDSTASDVLLGESIGFDSLENSNNKDEIQPIIPQPKLTPLSSISDDDLDGVELGHNTGIDSINWEVNSNTGLEEEDPPIINPEIQITENEDVDTNGFGVSKIQWENKD